jgi:hypothetical protein
MTETIFEQETANLLDRASMVVKDFDNKNRETGAKYNIFTIADIATDERKICRVITDLLNPKGRHGKGDLYLKLFLDIVCQKIDGHLPLYTKNARVTREHPTYDNRRIDIVIDDGNIFVPVEVKIGAGEQKDQLADYAKYAKSQNNGRNIPVLFLTPWGSEPKTALGFYVVCISFRDDILSWLEKCLSQKETEHTAPVYEIIKQFINAVKSICGHSEDEAMNKEIVELITQSEETIRAAVAISSALEDFDEESWKLFKGGILDAVNKKLPQNMKAEEYDDVEEGSPWHSICVPLLNGKYELLVTYNWKTIQIYRESDKADPDTEKKLAEKMSEITRYDNKSWNEEIVWATIRSRYPGMEDVDDAHYDYERYRLYSKNPDDVAQQIVSIAQALEKV